MQQKPRIILNILKEGPGRKARKRLEQQHDMDPSTSGIINIVVIIVIIIVAGDLEMHPIIFAGGPMPQSGTISNSHPAFDMDNDSA
ncbi:uncharacterized protein UV8b_07967 [Ustilaginoidea virens]|uniref:Uncharacterized protein n=1 Tax=Ustilaginoidea virens TaxID=1159556 RepID=A0A8E5HY78_USTVR|nr:uncharacterized protein UV8b_07967 [Ustilaginoidea virens]QUC23726.1 hypothetical protein UV8b_07967 [Ustilaginoidea virens]